MTLMRQITLKEPMKYFPPPKDTQAHSMIREPLFAATMLNPPLANKDIGDPHSARTGKDIHQFIRNPPLETIK
jgi:hypothetical protein